LRIDEVLRRSSPLVQLRERLRDSTARFEAVRSCLPPAMVPHVQPGPVDELGWSLLAANASVAAKLRQCVPRLEEALRSQGWQNTVIRIKVHGPHGT
jgi:hypothetical protein